LARQPHKILAEKPHLFGTKFASCPCMKRKQFKFGMVVLVGLAGYFLTLSAVLMAFAGMSDGTGVDGSAGKSPHLHKGLPQKWTENSRPNGKFSPHVSSFHPLSAGKNNDNSCLSSPVAACGDAFDQNTGGSAAWNGQGAGDTIVTNGKGGPFGDHNFDYPTSYGFDHFGASGAISGPLSNTGENSGSSQSGGDGGILGTDGTPPGVTGPDPGTSGLPHEPDIAISPPTSEFFPSDPPGSGDGGPSTGTPASDPASPSDHSGTYLVPEPSTFWLLLTSLTAFVVALRPIGRARPAPLSRRNRIAITKR
jgi:hypothetical protein